MRERVHRNRGEKMKFQGNAYFVFPVRTSFDKTTCREENSISLGIVEADSVCFAVHKAASAFLIRLLARKSGESVLEKVEQLTVVVKRIDSD